MYLPLAHSPSLLGDHQLRACPRPGLPLQFHHRTQSPRHAQRLRWQRTLGQLAAEGLLRAVCACACAWVLKVSKMCRCLVYVNIAGEGCRGLKGTRMGHERGKSSAIDELVAKTGQMLVALLGAAQDTCTSKVDVDFDGHVVCASYGRRSMGAPRSCCAGCRWWSRRIAAVCFLVVFFSLEAQGKCEVFSSSTCTQDTSRCVDMHPPLGPRPTRVHTPSRSHRSPSLQREVVFFSFMLCYAKTLDAITHTYNLRALCSPTTRILTHHDTTIREVCD
jgi:hypothetical protein